MEIVNERENHLIFYIICFNGKDVCVLISGEHGNRNGMVGKGISLKDVEDDLVITHRLHVIALKPLNKNQPLKNEMRYLSAISNIPFGLI